MRIHLTRAATFSPICQFLEIGGIEVGRRLADLGIRSDQLQNPESLVPLRQCARFVDWTARKDGIEHLGIEAGSRTPVGELGLFGAALRQSLTLKNLIDRFLKLLPEVDSGAKAWVERGKDQSVIRFSIEHLVDDGKAQVNEYGLMLMIDAVRIAAGPSWRPPAVWMNRRLRKGAFSGFEILADAEVRFHPNRTGFEIPVDILGTPVRKIPSESLSSRSEKLLRNSAPPDDLVGSVTCAIRSGLAARSPSLDEVSEMAGTSRRGMQRALQSHGTSFQELLDRVRFDEATTLLDQGHCQISEIAWRLGYKEVSNFSHAFGRWTGCSPTAYRDRFLAP